MTKERHRVRPSTGLPSGWMVSWSRRLTWARAASWTNRLMLVSKKIRCYKNSWLY